MASRGAGSRDRGERAEREIAEQLTQMLDIPIRRKLGAGRLDDIGDLDGMPGWTIQVADWSDALRAIREKPSQAEVQRQRAGTKDVVTFVRLRGGIWRAVQTPWQWVNMVKGGE